MSKLSPLDPNHEAKRAFIGRIGFTLMLAGVPTAILGACLFLSVFFQGFDLASPSPGARPVIGLILTALGGFASMIGLQLLALGNLGRIARYQMAETLPPTMDAARHAAPVVSEVAHEIAAAVGEGWRGGEPLAERVCAACQTPNDADARFCDACGTAFPNRSNT